MSLVKVKAFPIRVAARRFFFIQLVLSTLLVSMYAAYSHLSGWSERLYFPFERWPEGRANRVPPPEGRLKPGVHAKQMRVAAAQFAQLKEAVVSRYMRFHKSQRFNSSAPKLIYMGMGNRHGFGDRFRGILNAYELALLSQRVLLLAWREPFPLDLVFESAPDVSVFYDPRIDPGPLPLMKEEQRQMELRGIDPRTDGDPLPWCGCTLPTQCTRDNPGILLSDEKDVVIRSECTASLNGLMKSLQEYGETPVSEDLAELLQDWGGTPGKAAFVSSMYSLVFHALLRPSPHLIDRMAYIQSDLRDIIPPRLRRFRQGRSRGYISVHARIGYGLGEGKNDAYARRFDLEAQGASIQMVAACLAKTAAEEADDADLPEPQTFYIATDTPEFADDFRNEIEKWSKGAIVKEMGAKIVHSNKMRENSEEDREAFVMTGADLFFLSAGERLVSLPSWFANLAKYLGDVPHTQKFVQQCVRDAKSLRLYDPDDE